MYPRTYVFCPDSPGIFRELLVLVPQTCCTHPPLSLFCTVSAGPGSPRIQRSRGGGSRTPSCTHPPTSKNDRRRGYTILQKCVPTLPVSYGRACHALHHAVQLAVDAGYIYSEFQKLNYYYQRGPRLILEKLFIRKNVLIPTNPGLFAKRPKLIRKIVLDFF